MTNLFQHTNEPAADKAEAQARYWRAEERMNGPCGVDLGRRWVAPRGPDTGLDTRELLKGPYMKPFEIALLACRLAELEYRSAEMAGERLHTHPTTHVRDAVALWRAVEAELNNEVQSEKA